MPRVTPQRCAVLKCQSVDVSTAVMPGGQMESLSRCQVLVIYCQTQTPVTLLAGTFCSKYPPVCTSCPPSTYSSTGGRPNCDICRVCQGSSVCLCVLKGDLAVAQARLGLMTPVPQPPKSGGLLQRETIGQSSSLFPFYSLIFLWKLDASVHSWV